MSWELVSFLIVGAVLVVGFAWYELSRPPAQVVALVAALAALAIAGRIAFAAFPNVKPTTDIVIFAGYALGGAPGFVVGALTALVSNFWFGQGPWTPWQMVAWGLCGLLGAALALGTRNVGRLTLAAVCGLAGVAYGALLNFSTMATAGGDLSWHRFLFFEGQAVAFDAAHATANIVLALVAGPAMIRMLIRFRERFEWSRRDRPPARTEPRPGLGPALGGGVAASLLLVLLATAALLPAPARAADAAGAASWLVSVQNPDGGFGVSPGSNSGAETTCWVMLGLEAAGRNPLDVVSAKGKTPVDFLRTKVAGLSSAGDLARTTLALEGAGVDPRQFGGHNLVAELLARRRSNGSFEGWPGSTAYAVLALRGAGSSGGLGISLDWLRGAQDEDGGWGDLPNSSSSPDVTGAVMQAISPGSQAMGKAINYLRAVQGPGGGFPLTNNGEINSQSTAWVIQGILAAGGNPDSYRHGGNSAPGYLSDHQAADGHFRYSTASDRTPIWVTGQALVAAANTFIPITPPPREPKPAVSPSTSVPGSSSEPPSSVSPSTALESPVVPPESTHSGGAGPRPERFAPPGPTSPGASATPNSPAGRERAGSSPSASEPSASSTSDPSTADGSSTDNAPIAGSIIAGLLAGALLFGAAWAARRVWMRRRYGV